MNFIPILHSSVNNFSLLFTVRRNERARLPLPTETSKLKRTTNGRIVLDKFHKRHNRDDYSRLSSAALSIRFEPNEKHKQNFQRATFPMQCTANVCRSRATGNKREIKD